jgi:hypothetical protein
MPTPCVCGKTGLVRRSSRAARWRDGIRRVLVRPVVDDRYGDDQSRGDQRDKSDDWPTLVGLRGYVTRDVGHGVRT